MADQSTKDYLFSKEGRPVLIGVILVLIIVPTIGWWSYQSLWGSNDEAQPRPSTAETRRAAGQSEVRSADTRNLSPDLTSQNLTDEQRSALEQYNQQQNEAGRMGQPTPDDVVLIDVEERNDPDGLPVGEEGRQIAGYDRNGNPVYQDEVAGRTIIGYGDNGKPIFGDPDNSREIIGYTDAGEPIYAAGSQAPANLTPQQRRDQARAEQARRDNIAGIHEEYRNRRFQAAVELINFEGTPPSPNGMAFAKTSANESEAPSAARIDSNGSGQSRLVREGEEGGGTGSCEFPLVRGGEIRYAQTDIALNTDYQGPVRMTFLEGNLRGYIGMGTFELNELGAKMKLKIDTLFDPDGQSYQVSAWVLDPNTTLWAMASNVDRHIIYRYGGFGLGVVLGAFQTLAENRATISETVTPDGTVSTQNRDPDGKQVTWTLLGEFGELFEEAFRENINRPITVTLDPNEEAGVLFEDTVCELNTEKSKARRAKERREAKGFGDPLG
ncbi:hypothetical protein AWH63_10290 [Marinobacter sp. C18]|uniref:DotG/IcmE/VirB10 family protein n=1 Tax=Marinobacter sp. C18 TaxID=1772288 RepID=UPI0009491317|nr:DotG/IcmE/VirB10 family protein [Marinobacter sp. C18]OLF81921.1 hypothetical protein AWH63_10290 [Marinobacter sp. C18]